MQYRGYSIEDLASNATWEEVAYLILHGELPSADALAAFSERIRRSAAVNSSVIDILRLIPSTASFMDVMRTGASLLAHWDPEVADNSHEANLRKSERLLAQLPVVLAARQRLTQQQAPIGPDENRSFANNLLWMLNGEEPTERAVKAIDVSLILYVEHEYNASTFTARVVSSTLADQHSATTAALDRPSVV